eukprot:1112508-Pelagomonas_calceolata.AAC.1
MPAFVQPSSNFLRSPAPVAIDASSCLQLVSTPLSLILLLPAHVSQIPEHLARRVSKPCLRPLPTTPTAVSAAAPCRPGILPEVHTLVCRALMRVCPPPPTSLVCAVSPAPTFEGFLSGAIVQAAHRDPWWA